MSRSLPSAPSLRLAACAAALLASLPASAQRSVTEVVDALGAGRTVERAQLDASIPAWDLEGLDRVLAAAAAAADDGEDDVRLAARALLADLAGFAERTPRASLEVLDDAALEEARRAAEAAVHLVTALGSADDLVHGAGHGATLFATARSKRGPREAVINMTLAAMRGDPRAVAGLRVAYRAAEPDVVHALVEGVVRRGEPDDLSVAVQLLGERPDSDPFLLGRIELLVRRGQRPLHAIDLARLRAYLTDDAPTSRATAARIAGRLEDFEAVPALLELLGDRESSCARAAHGALQDITGLRFGFSVQRWRSWHAREVQWWDARGAALVAELPTLARRHRVTVLNALSSHPLHRRRIAPVVEPFLGSDDVATVMMSLSVLESIRSEDSADRIAPLLSHGDEGVRELAGKALLSLTGVLHFPGGAPSASTR